AGTLSGEIPADTAVSALVRYTALPFSFSEGRPCHLVLVVNFYRLPEPQRLWRPYRKHFPPRPSRPRQAPEVQACKSSSPTRPNVTRSSQKLDGVQVLEWARPSPLMRKRNTSRFSASVLRSPMQLVGTFTRCR